VIDRLFSPPCWRCDRSYTCCFASSFCSALLPYSPLDLSTASGPLLDSSPLRYKSSWIATCIRHLGEWATEASRPGPFDEGIIIILTCVINSSITPPDFRPGWQIEQLAVSLGYAGAWCVCTALVASTVFCAVLIYI